MPRRLLTVVLVATALSGCSGGRESATTPYDGPLFVTRDDATHPRAGAAGDVVQCDTWGTGGFEDAAVVFETATAKDAEQAIEWGQNGGLGPYGLQQDELRVAAETDDRVLYVVEQDGVPKQALIVHDGQGTKGAGGDGWYIESWAQCDPVELPSYAGSIGLEIWTDTDGDPVPGTELEAWVGPEHCSWESMIFLYLGKKTYVREPQSDLHDYFAEEYDEHATVPEDAVDTGYRRDGDRVWIAADRQRVYVGPPDDAELWPATLEDLGCA